MRLVVSSYLTVLASSESCQTRDESSLIQSAVRKHGSNIKDRFQQMLESSREQSEACVNVMKGEVAPMHGIFSSNGHRVEVSVGNRAPSSGSFCIQSGSLALLERSFGLSTAADFENAMEKKGSTESTMQEKGGKKKTGGLGGGRRPLLNTEPWDCSDGEVGRTCDWVLVDKWFRKDMDPADYPKEQIILDTWKDKPLPGVDFGPCRNMKGSYYRVDQGKVEQGQRQDGSLSESGYVTEDGCNKIAYNRELTKWQIKYVCDGLDEENYVQKPGSMDSGGVGVRTWPMSSWFSEAETCVAAVQGMNSGHSCQKNGAGFKCARPEKALCREDNDMAKPEKAAGSLCDGGQCAVQLGSMTCLPQKLYDCRGKSAGDSCADGSCTSVPKYNSTWPPFAATGDSLVCQ